MSKETKSGLGLAIFGVIAAALGAWFYIDLVALEARGGTMKVHVLVKFLYEMGGKYAVLGVLGGVGALCFLGGIAKMFKPAAKSA
jgi:hypothetical protein